VRGTGCRSVTSQTPTSRYVEKQLSSDFFRAALGLGAGDRKATAAGEHGATIEMPNVLSVDRKVLDAEKLISVKPERTS
jgi:hypothetical protein